MSVSPSFQLFQTQAAKSLVSDMMKRPRLTPSREIPPFNGSLLVFRVLKECRGPWDILDNEELRWNKERVKLIITLV